MLFKIIKTFAGGHTHSHLSIVIIIFSPYSLSSHCWQWWWCLMRPFTQIWFWWTTLGQKYLPCNSKGIERGRSGCIRLFDAWSVIVPSNQIDAALFCRLGHWNYVDHCLFHHWDLQVLAMFSLVPPRPYCHGFGTPDRFFINIQFHLLFNLNLLFFVNQ